MGGSLFAGFRMGLALIPHWGQPLGLQHVRIAYWTRLRRCGSRFAVYIRATRGNGYPLDVSVRPRSLTMMGAKQLS